MSYKRATGAELQAVAEQMLEPCLLASKEQIKELRAEVLKLRKETHELRKRIERTEEKYRVLNLQHKASVARWNRAVNGV